ncbi:MAG: flagellar biosynthesis regulator FlaF [Verrucomicrobiota bacterium]|nr:flagellar biosynthesis regulator FlaF [Verrucomicrobiota bacterium]
MNSLADSTRNLATYRQVQKETLSGRSLEAAVLGKAAARMRKGLDLWELDGKEKELIDALKYNLRVWDVFHSDWEGHECTLPDDMRNDLLRLSIYVHKSVLEMIAYPNSSKINSLALVNESLSAGLMGRTAMPIHQA